MTTLELKNPETLKNTLAILRSVAWGTAKILHTYYQGEMNEIEENKKDGPVTTADLAANHYILEKLQKAFGTEQFGYLSEETYKGTEPLPQDWVWIIDPLDGTRDFIDKTGEYAVHIALLYKGQPMLAAVAVPEARKVYFAAKGQGTFVETSDGKITPVSVSQRNQVEALYLVVSRTHRDRRFQDTIDRMPFKDRNYVGSVGCKVSTIIEQRSDVYISLSGKSAPKDWDFAAPELILTEAGGKMTYFDGKPLKYNRGDVRQWGGIMASNGYCHEDLCQMATEILEDIDRKGT